MVVDTFEFDDGFSIGKDKMLVLSGHVGKEAELIKEGMSIDIRNITYTIVRAERMRWLCEKSHCSVVLVLDDEFTKHTLELIKKGDVFEIEGL